MEAVGNNHYLGTEKIPRLLLRFSIPCVLSLLISALYNIVDQIFIGNSELGVLGNAATGVVFPLIVVAQAFAWCIGDGAAAYLSICQGKRDVENLHHCVGNSLMATAGIGVVLAVAVILGKEPILKLLGASEQTIGMAGDYLVILLAFFPAFMLMNMMSSIIRADGSPGFSMFSAIVGAIINIVLDALFIFGFHWGIQGAAWATVIGQTVSFLICAVYFFRPKTFRLTLASFRPQLRALNHGVKLGISTFITQMSIVAVTVTSNIVLSHYGSLSVYGPDIPISVLSIETKVFTIIINLVVGVVLGCQPILGYNYGARKYRRVREAYRMILLVTFAVGILSTLVIELCPWILINLFGTGDALYTEFATATFRIFLSLVTFTCVIKVTSIFFQAVGQPVKAAAASLIRDLVCFVPLAILLPVFFGIQGILFAAPVADLIAMIVCVCLTIPFFRKLKRAEEA